MPIESRSCELSLMAVIWKLGFRAEKQRPMRIAGDSLDDMRPTGLRILTLPAGLMSSRGYRLQAAKNRVVSARA